MFFSYQKKLILVFLAIFLFFPASSFALMKSNGYEMEPYVQDEGGGVSDSDDFEAVTSIGEIGEGFQGNKQDLGSGYPPMLGEEATLVIKAIPEKRKLPVGPGNLKTHLKLEISQNGTVSFVSTADTDNATGEATYYIDLDNFRGGTYDLGAKGYSHLKLIKRNISLGKGNNYIDMTNGETIYLLAGDANGIEGDNQVNSLDIGAVIGNYHTLAERTDFNLEGETNSIDIGILIDNYHKTGDSF